MRIATLAAAVAVIVCAMGLVAVERPKPKTHTVIIEGMRFQPESLTVEITGSEDKVEKFIDLMKSFGVLDLTRTGKVAMPRK